MATYIISFRILSDSTHADRWASVVDTIHGEAANGTVWEETTSLIILRSQKSPDALASSIYLGSSFSPSKDKLLVVDAHSGAYATRGEFDYPATLAGLLSGNALAGALAGL